MRKAKLSNLSSENTDTLLAVNYGLNYAKKLSDDKYHNKREETYIRELNKLHQAKWLNKESVKVKNKKIYSLNWNKIIDSFVEHLLEKFNYYKSMQGQYDRLNREKTSREKMRLIRSICNRIKISKRKERENLIPFFQKDAFVIAHENGYDDKMTDLFDEVVLGIGKYGSTLKKQRIDNLTDRVIFICHFLYIMDQSKLHNSLSNAFRRRIE